MDDRGRQAGLRRDTYLHGRQDAKTAGSSRKLRETIDKHHSEHSLLDHSLRGGGLVCPELPTPVGYGTVTHVELEGRTVVDICRRAESSPVVSLLRSDLSVPYAVRPYVRLDRVRHPVRSDANRETHTVHAKTRSCRLQIRS